jgi:hypothetical protein
MHQINAVKQDAYCICDELFLIMYSNDVKTSLIWSWLDILSILDQQIQWFKVILKLCAIFVFDTGSLL